MAHKLTAASEHDKLRQCDRSTGDHGFFTPNHNIPGPPHFRYFPPGSIISQILLVLAAATAFIDFHNMARAQRLRADLIEPLSRELKDKGHSHSGVVFCTALENSEE